VTTTHGAGGASFADVPIDPGELAAHVSEEELTLSVAGNEERLLEEVESALARLDRGSFGACTACGKPIAKERLKAVPYAATCMRCARRPAAATA
jgi:DnaK suppressor protein